jgi:hypothetical protein
LRVGVIDGDDAAIVSAIVAATPFGPDVVWSSV